jgi:protein-disulfide isomerase
MTVRAWNLLRITLVTFSQRMPISLERDSAPMQYGDGRCGLSLLDRTGGTSVQRPTHRTLARLAALAIALAGTVMAAHADDPRLITPAAQAAILADLKTPAAGSKNADATIVEWFDYDCPFCRRTHPHLQDALRTDRDLRIVYKEWPVFGEVSEYAAQSALAANWQGRYLQAHDALISTPDAIADRAHVDATLRAAGIDMARLSRDRQAHAREITAILARSFTEAAQLDLKGTPGFLIGRQFVPRSLDLPQLRRLIAYARAP